MDESSSMTSGTFVSLRGADCSDSERPNVTARTAWTPPEDLAVRVVATCSGQPAGQRLVAGEAMTRRNPAVGLGVCNCCWPRMD
jgi:hypothetical protein